MFLQNLDFYDMNCFQNFLFFIPLAMFSFLDVRLVFFIRFGKFLAIVSLSTFPVFYFSSPLTLPIHAGQGA